MRRIRIQGIDIDEFVPYIRKAVSKIVRNQEDAEDVVQETLIRLMRAAAKSMLPRFRSKEVIKSYIWITARNAAIDLLRREKERGGDKEPLDTVASVIEEDAPHHSYIVAYTPVERDPFIEEAVAQAISQIPEVQRQVLIMRIEGHSYEEIARSQRTNRGTVRSRLYYARKLAQKLLAELKD